MFLGLLISTVAPSEEAAVAVLPLIVLPQLLLTAVSSNLTKKPGGYFHSLVVLFDKGAEGGRGVVGWLMEGLSLLTYSRPALVFFLDFHANDAPKDGKVVCNIINWSHVFLMLLATVTVFVALFYRRERRWLEQG
jgi:hypothetical protein